MKPTPDSELLSLYLDGELSPAETAEVERLLAEDPAARQLLQELRALSAAIRDLPTYQLDEDLSQQVLREAEWRVLTERSGEPAAPNRWQKLRRYLRPRNLLWPAVAAAAALLIALRTPEGPKQVAQDDPPAVETNGEVPSISAVPEKTLAVVAQSKPAMSEVAEGLVVVHCDVAQSDAAKNAFQRVLRSHEIDRAQLVKDDRGGTLRRIAEGSSGAIKVSRWSAIAPEFVQSEASTTQIEAIVAEMRAHPEWFPNTNVQDRGPDVKPGQAARRQVLFVVRFVPAGK